jgi:hypothetical protein
MSRTKSCGSVLAAALSFFMLVSPSFGAIVVGQNGVVASKYANFFDPNLDGTVSGAETTITSGAIGAGAVSGSTLERVVNRVDQRSSAGGGRIQDAAGVATKGFMQFQATTPFSVGTVMSVQKVTEGFNSNMAFDLKLGTSGGTSTVQSGPGTVGTHPFSLTNFEFQKQNLTHLRIEENLATFNAGTARIGDFQEVLLFSDRLEVVPVTSITATAPSFGSTPAINDFSGTTGASGVVGGWATGTPGANPFFQLNFGSAKKVDGFVLANWENIPISGNILDDTNTIIAQFTMTGDNTFGEILPIEFITPVTTSFLRVNFTNSGAIGVREAIVLTQIDFAPAPEPSTLCLGMLGLLGLAKLRRRVNAA